MDKPQRDRIVKIIKARNQEYLSSIATNAYSSNFDKTFTNLTRKTRSLMRKVYGSENSINEISRVGRLVSGLMEDIKQNKAPSFDFSEYKKILNDYLINYFDTRGTDRYRGLCSSYGETLFVLYLDLFMSATIHKPERELQANPPFLINPRTGSRLEIDALFEDFRLAFEFQGEYHYTDLDTQDKDRFKRDECRRKKIILIPINISQLNSKELQSLIVNSIKDFLEIHDLFTSSRSTFRLPSNVGLGQIGSFCRVTERLFISTAVFDACTAWLDNKAAAYIATSRSRSPISSTTPAPRQAPAVGDFDIAFLHRNLKHVTLFRKSLHKPKP